MSIRSGPSATVTNDGEQATDPRVGLVSYLERGPAAAPLSERSQAGHMRNERKRVKEMGMDLQKWEETWKKAATK